MSNPYDAQGQGPGQQNPHSGDGAWSSQPYSPNQPDGAPPPPPGAYGQPGEALQGAPTGPPQSGYGAGQPMPYDQDRDSANSGPQPASIVRGPRQPGGTPAWAGPSARGGTPAGSGAAPASHEQPWGQPAPGAAPAAPAWGEQPAAPGWGEQPEHRAPDQQQPQEQGETSGPGWGAAAADAGVGATAVGAGVAERESDNELAPGDQPDSVGSTARNEDAQPEWGSPSPSAPAHDASGEPSSWGTPQGGQASAPGDQQQGEQQPGGPSWGGQPQQETSADQGQQPWGERAAQPSGQPQEDSGPGWGAPAAAAGAGATAVGAGVAAGGSDEERESDQADAGDHDVAQEAPRAAQSWGEQGQQPPSHHDAPSWGQDFPQPPSAPGWGEQPIQQGRSQAAPGWGEQPVEQEWSQPAPPAEQAQPHPDAPGDAAPIDHQSLQPGADNAGVAPNKEAEELPTQVTPAVSEPPTGDEPADEALTIGRGRANSIVLDDMLVSRQHVRITVDDEGLVLEDLGSRNGTFVNGRRVERTHLHEGDRIGIGASTFEVRDGWLVSL